MADIAQEARPVERDSELIWSLMPERLNRHSSVWWFFLLFPRQAGGYGPQQLMFVTIAKAGEWFRVNGRLHRGLDHERFQSGGETVRFPAANLGWVYDGRQMHEGMFNRSAWSMLSGAGYLESGYHADGCRDHGIREPWRISGNGRCAGSLIRRSKSGRPYGLAAEFAGRDGRASFEVWGEPGSAVTAPAESVDVCTPLGSSHVVAWQRLAFEGEFCWPGGGQYLSGLGYFQRVCLNFNPFPWKWLWALYEDGSVFSCFVPYIGPHLFRRGQRFFHPVLEQAAIPIKGGGYFFWADRRQRVDFDRRRVTPILNGGRFPEFVVRCDSKQGDWLGFRAVPHAQASMLLEEGRLDIWPSRFSYNEYLFEIRDLQGWIGGRAVSAAVVGRGYGNCEYTWGLGR